MESTTVSINNNKRRFVDVRNNIQFGIQDVYNQNTVLNQESLRNSVGGSVNNRDSVRNTNTCINNNKRSLDEVGNNMQFRFQDVYNNSKVFNQESLRNNVKGGVNNRDSVGNTNSSITNNKKRIDKVGNNIRFGFHDVYNKNKVLNQESLRNSVGSGVKDRDSVGNTNASITNNIKRINEVGNNIRFGFQDVVPPFNGEKFCHKVSSGIRNESLDSNSLNNYNNVTSFNSTIVFVVLIVILTRVLK